MKGKVKRLADMTTMREGHFLACLNFETFYILGGDNFLQPHKMISLLEKYDVETN